MSTVSGPPPYDSMETKAGPSDSDGPQVVPSSADQQTTVDYTALYETLTSYIQDSFASLQQQLQNEPDGKSKKKDKEKRRQSHDCSQYHDSPASPTSPVASGANGDSPIRVSPLGRTVETQEDLIGLITRDLEICSSHVAKDVGLSKKQAVELALAKSKNGRNFEFEVLGIPIVELKLPTKQ